jgi:hypothetical protein
VVRTADAASRTCRPGSTQPSGHRVDLTPKAAGR